MRGHCETPKAEIHGGIGVRESAGWYEPESGRCRWICERPSSRLLDLLKGALADPEVAVWSALEMKAMIEDRQLQKVQPDLRFEKNGLKIGQAG